MQYVQMLAQQLVFNQHLLCKENRKTSYFKVLLAAAYLDDACTGCHMDFQPTVEFDPYSMYYFFNILTFSRICHIICCHFYCEPTSLFVASFFLRSVIGISSQQQESFVINLLRSIRDPVSRLFFEDRLFSFIFEVSAVRLYTTYKNK